MGWDCTVALMKCQQAFGTNQRVIAGVITSLQAGTAPTSCNATMTVLSMVMCPGRTTIAHSVTSKAKFVPKQATDHMEALVDGDDAIFVSIWPDHHFTVLPLDANKVAILQGFQGTYDLFEWITSSGKIPMARREFLDNFKDLLSSTPAASTNAAEELFAIPGKGADIRDYFRGKTPWVKALVSQSPNLFPAGDVGRAQLSIPG